LVRPIGQAGAVLAVAGSISALSAQPSFAFRAEAQQICTFLGDAKCVAATIREA
jgi:hypothetical protein